MLKITSEAIYLAATPLGEGKQVTRVFSKEEGLLSGVSRPRKETTAQLGTLLEIEWQARLSEQLGNIRFEPAQKQLFQPVFLQPLPMLALMSMCNFLIYSLPERMQEANLYSATKLCLQKLATNDWLSAYVQWECVLLDAMGFGLDVTECAGGGQDRLCYISPKTGKAVSFEKGKPYKDKLFTMPECFLFPQKTHPMKDYIHALGITQVFLSREDSPSAKYFPEFRKKLAEKLQAMA